jgi:hypothetical protein
LFVNQKPCVPNQKNCCSEFKKKPVLSKPSCSNFFKTLLTNQKPNNTRGFEIMDFEKKKKFAPC